MGNSIGKTIMRIEKSTSQNDMGDRYSHNMRFFDVRNADPLRTSQNREPVDQLYGQTYWDVYKAETTRLRAAGAITRNIRHDAVKGFEVYLGFSHEAAEWLDLEAWMQRSVEWLERTFNPPGGMITYTDREGRTVTEHINNVKSVVLHMDEGTPHLHAFIVPIDERGHLNASAYSDGRDALSRMQDTYAEAVAEFGLERGTRHSPAKHEKVTEYYRKLEQAVDSGLPQPLPGESVDGYYRRATEAHQIAMVHQRDGVVRDERRITERQAELYDRKVEAVSREAELDNMELRYRSEHRRLESLVSKIAQAAGEQEGTEGMLRRIKRAVTEQDCFRKAVREHPDRAKAAEAERVYNELIGWQKARERKQAEKSNPDKR